MRVLVIGGGAAGLMAAVSAAAEGHTVTVLERNERPARKLMITGKGRCNVTNDCTPEEVIRAVPAGGRFLYSALAAFSPSETMAFFERQGVPLKVERGNRVFPVSDRAVDVVDALVRAAKNAGVRFYHGRVAALRLADGVCRGATLESGEALDADGVIVCTGGLSYPGTGSTGDGYTLARQAGHTVTPLRPSLVPLECDDIWTGELQGLSLRNVTLSLEDTVTQRTLYRELGEMLFTHFGVSGPLVLSASAHMRERAPREYRLWIDWKPGLTLPQLDARLQRDFAETPNSDFRNALTRLLPHKAIPVLVRLSGIPGETKCHSLTRENRRRFAALLKAFPMSVSAFRPIAEAIVTAGGVDLREIRAGTMGSRLVSGLSFAGEVLDLDAYTGGFNLQIAFATGVCAGRGIGKQK